jgi:hypothetical protein
MLFLSPKSLAFAAKGFTGLCAFSSISHTAFASASTSSSLGSGGGGSCPTSFYQVSETDCEGKTVDFEAFRGKVVYAVNVASK